MLDKRGLDIIKRNVERYLRDKQILKEDKGKFVDFFLTNSRNSLDSAKLLFKSSVSKEMQKTIGFPDFN